MTYRSVATMLFTLLFASPFLCAQSAQVGAERGAKSTNRIRVDNVHYRPARWEAEKVKEFESEVTNKGGLVYVYFTNASDEPVNLHSWRMNGYDESYWRLSPFIAWDRCSNEHPEPGATSVLEINGIMEDVAEGKPFEFSYVDRDGRVTTKYAGELRADPVSVSFIRFPIGTWTATEKTWDILHRMHPSIGIDKTFCGRSCAKRGSRRSFQNTTVAIPFRIALAPAAGIVEARE